MKKIMLALILLLCSYAGFSQTALQIQSNGKGFYINHTVSPKENFYSIGRLYNISPKEIAAFNNVDMGKGLNVGQTIMIPLEKTNFSQTSSEGTPVYYTVGDKEGLYRVSLKNNKVLMANLRKWNHLTNDNITAGSKLIVGYLVAPDMQHSGSNAVAKSNNTTTTTAPADTAPASNTTAATNIPPTAPKPEPKREEEEPVVRNTTTPTNTPVPAASNSSDAGYFKSLYDQQIRTYAPSKDLTVTSGIFKTSSGWQDGKYYALLDGVEPGTIVRIINPNNSKTIYAKVLGQMSGIRQNQGLDLRISNAGADALSVTDTDKFIVRVIY